MLFMICKCLTPNVFAYGHVAPACLRVGQCSGRQGVQSAYLSRYAELHLKSIAKHHEKTAIGPACQRNGPRQAGRYMRCCVVVHYFFSANIYVLVVTSPAYGIRLIYSIILNPVSINISLILSESK